MKKFLPLFILLFVAAPLFVHAAAALPPAKSTTPVAPAKLPATPVPPTKPTAPVAPAAQQTAQTPNTNSSNFVPLTTLPGIQEVAASSNIIDFFNNLYKICIGVAAFLAVGQITFAGFMYMTAGGNAGKTGEARNKIQNAILGLVLVLSPVLVFSIINPRILTLDIDVSKLALNPTDTPKSSTAVGTGSGTGTNGGANPSSVDTSNVPSTQYQLPAGTYLWVLESYSKKNPSCLTIIMGDAPDQTSCQTALNNYTSKFKQANPDFDFSKGVTTLYSCVAPSGGSFSIPTAGLCATQPYLH